jgi:hypothetical protein
MHKTTILASLAAVLPTAGAAMAQEGLNDSASGAAYSATECPSSRRPASPGAQSRLVLRHRCPPVEQSDGGRATLGR